MRREMLFRQQRDCVPAMVVACCVVQEFELAFEDDGVKGARNVV